MKRAIVLMGKPGSGKSTVGKKVAEVLGWTYVSTGDIARALIAGDWSERGEMAPESAMRDAFETYIDKYDMVVLDGMPRKPEQVEYLDLLFDEVHYYVISISNQTATTRLLNRGRSDDTEVAIAQRLLNYETMTAEALFRARLKHPSFTMSGTMPVDEIVGYITHRYEGESR